jgi:uncharacterized protein with HEPN domain
MSKRNHEDEVIHLRHMLDFAQKAVRFNKGKSRSDLDSDEILAMATIHLIELIGEASRTVSEAFQEKYPEIPWQPITGTRNRLAHGYINIDLDIIWTIVAKDLPQLIKQLKHILKQEG